jgi:hypothetical protein
MSLVNHPENACMRQLCCLTAIGEISSKDQIILYKHLKVCQECRTLLKEMEQRTLFDLSAVAASRIEDCITEAPESESEDHVLGQLIEKTRSLRLTEQEALSSHSVIIPPCFVPFRKRVKRTVTILISVTGLAFALLITVVAWISLAKRSGAPNFRVASVSTPFAQIRKPDNWKERALAAERQTRNLQRTPVVNQEQIRTNSQSMMQMSRKNQKSSRRNSSLRSALRNRKPYIVRMSQLMLTTKPPSSTPAAMRQSCGRNCRNRMLFWSNSVRNIPVCVKLQRRFHPEFLPIAR